jgi:hypothetical protein
MSDPHRPDPPDALTGPEPDAPASEEERADAEKLRQALDEPRLVSDDAQLARALSAAWSPRDLSEGVHQALVEEALAAHAARRRRQRGRVVRMSFGASSVLALAAAVFLLVRGDRRGPETVRVAAVVVSRSTQTLFADPFAPTGGESARIDRIAMARGADLRENEFAKWGVR